jgi:ribulose-phosphate 3-epimerase
VNKSIICPTVLAPDAHDYQVQMNKISGFAKRIQVDLTDGIFAHSPTVTPEQVWWPEGTLADVHLMYKDPKSVINRAIKLLPNMVIVHAEAEGDFIKIADKLHSNNIKVGVALLAKTSTHLIKPSLGAIDHVLIFSGDLGKFGGIADLKLLEKVAQIKEWKNDIEFGWDGGVNDNNVNELSAGGINVLNVGGYIQNAPEPRLAYEKLQKLIS